MRAYDDLSDGQVQPLKYQETPGGKTRSTGCHSRILARLNAIRNAAAAAAMSDHLSQVRRPALCFQWCATVLRHLRLAIPPSLPCSSGYALRLPRASGCETGRSVFGT